MFYTQSTEVVHSRSINPYIYVRNKHEALIMTRFLLFIILTLSIVSCSSRARLEKKDRKDRKSPSSSISQHYDHLTQEIYCGQEPIVRFANFTFDKSDSLRITVDITTSLNEGKINGDLTLLLDEYELEYASIPNSKQYVETLEVESQSRYPSQFRGRQNLANILINSATRKTVSRNSQKQYWNTVSIVIEPEDKILMLGSSDIFFSIKTKKCRLIIYPSYEHVRELKRFLY